MEKMYILFSNCFQWAFCLSNLISRKKAPHYLQICISAHPDIMLICSLHSAQCAHTAHPVHAHLHICIYSFERCSVYVYVCDCVWMCVYRSMWVCVHMSFDMFHIDVHSYGNAKKTEKLRPNDQHIWVFDPIQNKIVTHAFYIIWIIILNIPRYHQLNMIWAQSGQFMSRSVHSWDLLFICLMFWTYTVWNWLIEWKICGAYVSALCTHVKFYCKQSNWTLRALS